MGLIPQHLNIVGGAAAFVIAGGVSATTPTSIVLDLGITPEALAAAGASLTDAEDLLANVAAATEEVASWSTAVAALTVANEDLTALQSAANEGSNPPSGEEILGAQAAITAAKQDLASAMTSLREAALGDLGSSVRGRVEAFVASGERRVPDEFRVLSLDPEQWDALEAALIEERRAARLGIEISEESAQLLATTRGLSEVSSAAVALAQTLTAIEAAMTTE